MGIMGMKIKKGIIKRLCFVLGVYLILASINGIFYWNLGASWARSWDSPSEARSTALMMWTDNLCGPFANPAWRPRTTNFKDFAYGLILMLIFVIPILGYLIKSFWLTKLLVIIFLALWFFIGFVIINAGV